MTGDRHRVVIIDDSGPIRSILARAFREHGIEPHGVATSVDAFVYIGSSVQDPPDVFVIDARMEDGTGADIVRIIRHNRLRSRRTGRPVRVVAYTGLRADDPMVADMVAAGADAVAYKDGDFEHLLDVVRGGPGAGDVERG